MTFLPIVERELRVAARRRGVYWARLIAATVAIVVGGAILALSAEMGGTVVVGHHLFVGLSAVAYLVCLAAGPIFTADALSEERREGTLGLLFLTDLHGYDVVLGKLAAAAVPALYCVLASLPVLAIPTLIGGVSLTQFLLVALLLLSTLLFSLFLGLAVSSFCLEARSAYALTAFCILLLAGVVPALVTLPNLGASPFSPVSFVTGPGGSRWVVSGETIRALGFATICPTFGLSMAISTTGVWWHNASLLASLLGPFCLSGLCLLVSGWQVRHAYADAGWGRRSGEWRRRWNEWNFGQSLRRRELRRRLLNANPMLWLGSRNRLKRKLIWALIVVLVLVWVGGAFTIWRQSWDSTLALLGLLIVQAGLKWIMASEATYRWAEDLRAGAFELLLTTPMTVPEMLQGQLRALFRLVVGPAAILLAAGLFDLWLPSDRYGQATWCFLVLMGLFLWDLHTLAWYGLWQSVRCRKPTQAFYRTVFGVLVLPWLVFLMLLFVGGRFVLDEAWFFWLILGIAFNVYYYADARTGLRSQIRARVTERFEPTRSVS